MLPLAASRDQSASDADKHHRVVEPILLSPHQRFIHWVCIMNEELVFPLHYHFVVRQPNPQWLDHSISPVTAQHYCSAYYLYAWWGTAFANFLGLTPPIPHPPILRAGSIASYTLRLAQTTSHFPNTPPHPVLFSALLAVKFLRKTPPYRIPTTLYKYVVY